MDPAHSFAAGTVGHLLHTLRGGPLVGTRVEHAGLVVMIEEVSLDPGPPERDWGCRSNWRFRSGETTTELGRFVSLGAELAYPLHPRAVERCSDVLRAWLETTPRPELDDGLVEELMAALAPEPAPGTFAGWVVTDGLSFLTDDGVVARAARGGAAVELRIETLRIERRTARVVVESRFVRRDGAEIQDMNEQEISLGYLAPDVFSAPASSLSSAPYVALGEAFRKSFEPAVKAALASSELPLPHDVFSEQQAPIFSLVGAWLTGGPPPPRPVSWQPSRARLRRQAESVRRLGKAALSSLPRGTADVRAGLRIDGWQLLFAPGLKGSKLGADRILLREGEGTPIILLRSDDEIQNRLKYTIDGDARAMRELLRWLRELLRLANIDEHFAIVWPFDETPERRSLRAWLAFGWRDNPFDWRWSSDHIEDEHPYWDAHDEYLPPLPPAKQARIREVAIPTYYRFFRAVVNPRFVGKFERGSRQGDGADG